jgi:hypothetical protein
MGSVYFFECGEIVTRRVSLRRGKREKSRGRSISSVYDTRNGAASRKLLLESGLNKPIDIGIGKVEVREAKFELWDWQHGYHAESNKLSEKIDYCNYIIELASNRNFLFKNVIGVFSPPLDVGLVLDAYTEISTKKFTKLKEELLNALESVILRLKSHTNKT